MFLFVIFVITLPLMAAEYSCVCSPPTGLLIFQTMSLRSSLIGILSKGNCVRQVHHIDHNWCQVSFNNQNGFVYLHGDAGPLTNCLEENTAPQYITTTTHSSESSTTAYSATPPRHQDTRAPTISPSSSQQNTLPTLTEGHTELCPYSLQVHNSITGGFIGQYGHHCYEFNPTLLQHTDAQRKCETTLSGNLTDITDPMEQKYLERFMSSHGQTKPAWIGLQSNFNKLQWSSGSPVQYTHFAANIGTNHNDPCFVFQPNGQWKRTKCGVSLPLWFGYGEKHPFICKYSLTGKPLPIVESAINFLIGR